MPTTKVDEGAQQVSKRSESINWLTRIAAIIMPAQLLKHLSSFAGKVIDDLMASGLVEWLFLTRSSERFTVLMIMVVGALLIILVSLKKYGANKSFNSVLALITIIFSLVVWLILPYKAVLNEYTKWAIVLLPGILSLVMIIIVQRTMLQTTVYHGYILLASLFSISLLVFNLTPLKITIPCIEMNCWLQDRPLVIASGQTSSELDNGVGTAVPTAAGFSPIIVPSATPVISSTPEGPAQTAAPPPSPTPWPTAVWPTVTSIPLTVDACPKLHLRSRPPAATHLVEARETLESLASRYNISVKALILANAPHYPTLRERPDCIRVDWWLIIPSR